MVRDEFDRDSTTFAADPEHRYLVGIGCDAPSPCWADFTLEIKPV